MSRLIHYKVKTNHRIGAHTEDGALSVTGPGLISADHNEMIGGNGPLEEKALPLVFRKLCKKHNVEMSNIVIVNIILLKDD